MTWFYKDDIIYNSGLNNAKLADFDNWLTLFYLRQQKRIILELLLCYNYKLLVCNN